MATDNLLLAFLIWLVVSVPVAALLIGAKPIRTKKGGRIMRFLNRLIAKMHDLTTLPKS